MVIAKNKIVTKIYYELFTTLRGEGWDGRDGYMGMVGMVTWAHKVLITLHTQIPPLD